MARTAPDASLTATGVRVGYRFIDASGDIRTISEAFDPAQYTPAEVEALAVEMGTSSRANLWEISVTQLWTTVEDASQAENEPKTSVFDNVVIHFKNAIGGSKRWYIPAPNDAIFVGGAADQVNPASALYTDVRDAFLAMLAAGYAPVSIRYTERREINAAIRPT